MSEQENQDSNTSSAGMGSNNQVQFVRRHHLSNANGEDEVERGQENWAPNEDRSKEKEASLYTPGEYKNEHGETKGSLMTTVLQWSRKNCCAWDSPTMVRSDAVILAFALRRHSLTHWALQVLLWVVFFYVSSVMANIMNKQLVDDHHASPTMLTFWHIAYALAIDCKTGYPAIIT